MGELVDFFDVLYRRHMVVVARAILEGRLGETDIVKVCEVAEKRNAREVNDD